MLSSTLSTSWSLLPASSSRALTLYSSPHFPLPPVHQLDPVCAGALAFLAECIAEASTGAAATATTTAEPLLHVNYDRYGGAEMEVAAAAGASVGRLEIELGAAVIA